MSNPIAGWYPDPSGDPGKLRYWDGSSWTEHVAPARRPAAGDGVADIGAAGRLPTQTGGATAATGQLPPYGGAPAQPTGQVPAHGEAPAQLIGQVPAHGEAPAQPTGHVPAHGEAPAQFTGQVPAGTQLRRPDGNQSGYGQQAPGQFHGGQQPYAQDGGGEQSYGPSPYATSSGQSSAQVPVAGDGDGSGRGAVIGIVIAAVVLAVVVIIAVVLLLSGDGEPAPRQAPTSALTQEPATQAGTQDDPTAEPDELELNATVAGAIAPGETWTATLTVAEATPVAVDVVAGTGDLTLTVSGDSATVGSDDRGDFMKTGAASSLDPALAAYLEPGEYTVSVSAYSGAADADFAVTTTVPEIVPAEGTIAVENGSDESWLAAIELEEPATLVLDAVSAEASEAVLAIFTSTGSIESAADRDESADSRTELHLESELPAGVHFISLGDYWGDPLSSELTIAAQ